MQWEKIRIEKLKALEYVFPHHLENLKNMILQDKFITQPLVIERDHHIVLDGSHKHIFLCLQGIKYAPVYIIDYNNPHVRVGSHRVHSFFIDTHPVTITKEEVIKKGLTGNLFPPRSTRHILPFSKPNLKIELSELGKREPIDMTKNIFTCNIKDEIEHNKHYIQEIEEETDVAIRYIEESRKTRKYLLKQIKQMEERYV